MSTKMERHKRYIFVAIIITTLGVSFTTTLKDSLGTLGVVFIAVGGFFFIVGMSMKRKDKEQN